MMIPRECKRLAEVDFPIAAVSRHSAREKSIRHGHPSTLHLWWARRPLSACRAVLIGLVLPDPCDANCPDDFKREAKKALRPVPGIAEPKDDKALRKALLAFIADFANWDLSASPTYLTAARALVKAAHGDEPPLVVDPFAGGGSIPLEALRVGCDTFASDLNPVACLILKVLLEDIPRHGAQLADELRRVGAEIKAVAEKELAEFYPPDPDGARPIAYLWARTVRCESPNCGAEIPLVRSFSLSRKKSRPLALRYTVKRATGKPPNLEFAIFKPKSDSEVPHGTVSRANATCPCCGIVLPAARVRAQLSAQHGGADAICKANGNRIGGAMLLAVVTMRNTTAGREFRLPTLRDYAAVSRAQKHLKRMLDGWQGGRRSGLCPVPDEPLPLERVHGNSGFRVSLYGMSEFGDLFSARQKITNVILRNIVMRLRTTTEATKEVLCLALSRRADISNAPCPWSSGATQVVHLFGRQAIPMACDYGETSPFGEQAGDYQVTLGTMIRVVDRLALDQRGAQAQIADATLCPLPDESSDVWFTDPPYYDAVAYADLSDFFFVWLKRALPQHAILRDPFDPRNPLAPKQQEIIQDLARQVDGIAKNGKFYETAMHVAFAEGHRIIQKDGIGSVVFAHKTTEGWEALLSGMVRGGWTVTASWPIATERPGRLLSQETAALATSVHLLCRPRAEDAPIGGWEDILRELPARIGDWMERLASERIRGADLVFSCIGPAMELFSRHPRVETAEGRAVELPEFLEKVWEVVGRTALEQVLGTAEARARNSAAGALEEDARLTALFLWTLQSTNHDEQKNGGDDEEPEDEGDEEAELPTQRKRTKGYALIYDITRRFAQPLGIHLDEWEGRVIETKKGVVRLLPVSERAQQLFGKDGAAAMAEAFVRGRVRDPQLMLFPEDERAAPPTVRGRAARRSRARTTEEEEPARRWEPTTLDRVHAAMLLQASGQSGALRALLEDEQRRGPDFFRLANALSALYPKNSEEKRLVDAMLLAVPRR